VSQESDPSPAAFRERFLMLSSDGTVAWESPAGWAAGARLVEFVDPEGRIALQTALSAAALDLQDRSSLQCQVVDPVGEWHLAEIVVMSATAADGPGDRRILVSIREIPATPVRNSMPHVTSVDDLTALGDRSALNSRLQAAEHEEETALAVMYLDVDLFKQVNDDLGHSAGDKVLIAVADRLRGAVRPGDVVTRIGGDEFVVVAGGVNNDEKALEIAERVRTSVGEPIQLGGRRITSTVSIGVAVGHGGSASRLLEQADSALYRAKDLGRNRSQIYRSTDSSLPRKVTEPEALLRSALDDGLVIVYEPVIGLDHDELVTVEASLRLREEDGELGAPDAVLRLAEKSGLIVSLGLGMLDLACSEISTWSRDNPKPPGLTWPMSARQLEEARSADQVLAIMSSHGIASERLTIQVAERSLLRPGSNARRNLDQLQRSGVTLSVGDFGAGPGSLELLLNYSFDEIKLDATFMSAFGEDRRNTELVKAMLTLGVTLRVRTVARGVHGKAQLELLRHMGCDAVQGPYFGGPVTSSGLAALPGQDGGGSGR
jgi:diguanylate cyclase (GGDEF)-like protein